MMLSDTDFLITLGTVAETTPLLEELYGGDAAAVAPHVRVELEHRAGTGNAAAAKFSGRHASRLIDVGLQTGEATEVEDVREQVQAEESRRRGIDAKEFGPDTHRGESEAIVISRRTYDTLRVNDFAARTVASTYEVLTECTVEALVELSHTGRSRFDATELRQIALTMDQTRNVGAPVPPLALWRSPM